MKRSLLLKSILLLGLIGFILNFKIINKSNLLLSLLFFLLSFVYINNKYRDKLYTLLPFSSGILTPFMRIFYWDKFDFSNRIDNLIVLSLVFSLILMIIEFDIFTKILKKFNSFSLKKRLIILFVFFELIFIISSALIVNRGIKLVGDEPHYLIITQSILKDKDLNVANQYYEQQYKEFLGDFRIGIHGFFGKKGNNYIYSMHLPGISFTLTPIFGLKLSPPLLFILIRSYLGIFASLFLIVFYLISLKILKREGLSFFITIVMGITSPIIFHSIHIFPEIQVSLFIITAIYLSLYKDKKSLFDMLLSGFLLGLVVFWGVKYSTFMFLYVGGIFIYYLIKKEYKFALSLIVFPLLFEGLFLYYLYNAYGNFSPMSVYMNEGQKKNFMHLVIHQISFKMRIETLLNYFFDQRDGLLLYNPFYIFSFTGFLIALKKYKKYLKFLLLSIPAILFILSYAALTHRGGHCPQARPLVPTIWFFVLFAGIFYIESNNISLKSLFKSLPFYSIFVVIYQIFNPLTLYQTTTHDNLYRAGLLFQELSNINIYLPKLLPSYVKLNNNEQYLPNIIFLIILTLFIIISYKIYNKNLHKDLFKTSLLTLFLFLILMLSIFPRIPYYNTTHVKGINHLAYNIYGASTYPKRVNERKFFTNQNGIYTYTFSTLRKPELIQLRFLNEEKNFSANINVYNFDKKILVKNLNGNKLFFNINKPKYKKFKGVYFFRITLKVLNIPKESYFYFQFIPFAYSNH